MHIFVVGIYLLIDLLTLFNVDCKTLAVYPLIKIDYPHKKHNKNVNKSIKEDNRMCTVLLHKTYMLNVTLTYSTWPLFTLPFSNFLFKMSKEDSFLVFSGTRLHI